MLKISRRRVLPVLAGLSGLPCVLQPGPAAAKEQIDRYIHCGSYLYYSQPVADMAEALAAITPGRLQKTFFSNSGAEAVEGAMRVAKAYSGRSEFIALQLGFHGRTNATLSLTGNAGRKTRGGPYVSGGSFAPAPHQYRCRFCDGSWSLDGAIGVQDVVRYAPAGDVAAFIAEPVLGEAGIIVPHRDYFRRGKEILDSYSILFIADEVQSGFGRTGRMLAIEHFGVEPDIVAMAKGIADGFPLGAFIATPEIADSFRPGQHLSTFGGNPVSSAARLANIEVLQADGPALLVPHAPDPQQKRVVAEHGPSSPRPVQHSGPLQRSGRP